MRVVIRPPVAGDEAGYLAALRRSAEFIRPWNPVSDTPDDYRRLLADVARRDAASYLIVDRADGGLAGIVNVRSIVRGRMQGGSLGYNAFLPYAGTGRTTEGLRLVVDRCFAAQPTGLGLHRLEINVQPGNDRSADLAVRSGFRLEGTARRMLYINGAWRDQDRYALTAEEWGGVPAD